MTETEARRRLFSAALCDWDRRLARERVLLERALASAPSRRVIDLGCGDGGHARYLAGQGYEVIGIDASEPALDAAQETPLPDGVQLILTDLGAVERSVRGHFGAALCLGNTLPCLLSPESASRMLVGLKRRLLPGAPVLVHTLNYDRIFELGERALPVRFVNRAEGELVVVELVEGRDDGIVLHTTTLLRHRLRREPPMEIVASRQNQLRGWRREEIETMLEVARLEPRELYGDMGMSPYDERKSLELVVVAS